MRNTWALPVCQAGSSHRDRTEFSSQHPPPAGALPCYFLLLLNARTPSTLLVENWYSRKVTNGSGTGLAFLALCVTDYTLARPILLMSCRLLQRTESLVVLSILSQHRQNTSWVLMHPCQQIDYCWRVKCRFPLQWDFDTWKFLGYGWKETWKHKEKQVPLEPVAERRKEVEEGNNLSKIMALSTLFKAVFPLPGI